MRRRSLIWAQLLAFVLALGAFSVNATACEGGGGGGGELTSLSTKLSGGGKEGAELTVSEGTKVKDKATLTGKNASKATGKVTYKVYSESACKTLVTSAGEVTVSGESVPASSEEELEAGKAYYWQAHYGGDTKNAESTSPCTEILDVQAKTSLSTKLSGGGEEGEEISVNEGTKVKDKATLSGTNSSTAGGKVLYKIFSDSKCEHVVKEAGEEGVSGGSATASEEKELEGGKIYYWQATYKGDGLHKESSSECGKEILRVKAKTTLSTVLSGGGEEGAEITVDEGSKVKDKATVEGTNSSTAEGKVLYRVFSDSKCEHSVKEAGEKSVTSGSGAASNEEELEGDAIYYWQATYKGDSLHQESKSMCGKEVLTVKAKTSLSTALSGEGKEGAELTVLEGAKVKDDATLGGSHSSSAGGKLVYKVFSDIECKTLVKEAGEVTVSSGSVPASSEEELEGGKTYYWQASYGGDSLHGSSMSSCGTEVLTVKAKTTITTTLSGEGKEGSEFTVLEGAKVDDDATLGGSHSSSAGGKVVYKVYSDNECKTLVTTAGEETVSSGSVPASSEEELEGGKTYYWQAHYKGDGLHQESTSECGDEIVRVKAKTALSTTLSGEGKEGSEITILEGAKATDKATLSGANASTAGGTVTYKVYSDKECKDLVTSAGEGSVSGESAGASGEEELEGGVPYYWQASYGGDGLHEPSTSTCGELLKVKAKTTLSTKLSGESEEGGELSVDEGVKARDTATLSGLNSSTATGNVVYKIYSDKECTTLVEEAGEVTLEAGAKIPDSNEEELEAGNEYYWQATYQGDGLHQEATSACGTEILDVCSVAEPGIRAATWAMSDRDDIEPRLGRKLWPDAAEGAYGSAARVLTELHTRQVAGRLLKGEAVRLDNKVKASAVIQGRESRSRRARKIVHRQGERAEALDGAASNMGFEALLDASFPAPASISPLMMAVVAIPHPMSLQRAREAAVLMRQGLSPMRAIQALEVQSEVAQTDLVSKVEAALGGAYAGAWFEPSTATLHIGVTSDPSRRATASVVANVGLRAHVTQTPVRSTRAALVTVQERWNAKLAKLLQAGDILTGIDSQRNAVVVKLRSSVPKQQRAALERAAASATVNVFIAVVPALQLRAEPLAANCEFVGSFAVEAHERAAWCEKTITSGVKISNLSGTKACTAGPMLTDGDKTFMLTAGHCTSVGERWYSEWPNPIAPPLAATKRVGTVTQTQYNKALDSAEIEVEQPGAGGAFAQALPIPVPARLAEWGNWQAYTGKPPIDEPAEPVALETGVLKESRAVENGLPAVKGFADCHEGKSTGEQCGMVGMENVSPGGKILTEHLVEDSACAEKGDSGGPYFYHGNGSEVFPEGTLSGGEGTCKETGQPPGVGVVSYFEPMKTLLAAYKGQRLLWAANEDRKPRQRGANGASLTKDSYSVESGASTIRTVAGFKLTCAAGSGVGEAGTETGGSAQLTLTGCEASGAKCHTPSATTGEVALSAGYELAFTDGEEDEVGLLLKLTEATIECGKTCEGNAPEKLKLRGTGIGITTPIDDEVETSKEFTIAFSESEGIQTPTEYETEDGEKAKAVLELEGGGAESFSFEQAGFSGTDELDFEETAEIEG